MQAEVAAVSAFIVLRLWVWSHSGWCNWQHKGKVEASTRQNRPTILAFNKITQDFPPNLISDPEIQGKLYKKNYSKSLNKLLKWQENVQISCVCCPLVAQHPSIGCLTPSFVSPTTASSTYGGNNNKTSESRWYFPTILGPPRPPLAIATSSHSYQSSPLGSLPCLL